MPLIKRFEGTIRGAIVLTGNTLQIRQSTPFPPGIDHANGSYITTNTALVAIAGFPPGTTFLSAEALSSAILDIPKDSTVLYAQLFWANSNSSNPDGNVNLTTPVGTFLITPDPAEHQNVGGITWRAREVTGIVEGSGGGVYSFGPSLGPDIVNNTSISSAGWFLIVVYENYLLNYRYINVNTGFSNVDPSNPSDFTFTNLITPDYGPVKGYLIVSETNGDLLDQAKISVGTSLATATQIGNPATLVWNGATPYAYIDNMLPGNILIADTQNPNIGLLDTRGTFGTFNKDPFATTAIPFARNNVDILGIDISDRLSNSQNSLFTRVYYVGVGGGAISSQSVQIDVNSAQVDMIKAVDKRYGDVGDTLTYTVSIKNNGLTTANNVIIIDTVPDGTAFVPGTMIVDGVTMPGSSPQLPGYELGSIGVNVSRTVTFKVSVSLTIPSPNPIQNRIQSTYNYVPAPGVYTVFTQGYSNFATTTILNAILQGYKAATPIVGIGDTIAYTVALTNIGNAVADNIRFIDTIPSGTSFLNGSLFQDLAPVAGNPQPPGITLPNSIGTGSTSTVQFMVTVLTIPSPNAIFNNSSGYFNYVIDPSTPTSGSGIFNSNAASTTINYGLITSSKTASKAYANVGDTITYTIVLKNTGVTTVNNYVFIDTTPAGTTFVTNSLQQDLTPVSGDPNPPGVTLPNSIGVNKTSTVTFSVTVNTIPTPNPMANNASGVYSFIGNPDIPSIKFDVSNSNTNFVQVNNASLGNIKKYTDKPYATCGDIITYTIAVPNSGNVTAYNIIVKDTVPNGTVFVTNSVTLNGTPQSGANPSLGITIPNIAPGITSTIVFKVRVQC